jgi:hypothetical protein
MVECQRELELEQVGRRVVSKPTLGRLMRAYEVAIKLQLRGLPDGTSKEHHVVIVAAVKKLVRYEDALPIAVRSDTFDKTWRQLGKKLKLDSL